MKIIIKSIEAELLDISTNEEDKFVICYWKVRYEVHFSITSIHEHRNIISGVLDWKREDVDPKVIVKYIRSIIKE